MAGMFPPQGLARSIVKAYTTSSTTEQSTSSTAYVASDVSVSVTLGTAGNIIAVATASLKPNNYQIGANMRVAVYDSAGNLKASSTDSYQYNQYDDYYGAQYTPHAATVVASLAPGTYTVKLEYRSALSGYYVYITNKQLTVITVENR